MRLSAIPLVLLLGLCGCKAEKPAMDVRSVRTVVVDSKPIHDDRHAIGEVKPRYESDLSFRVAGKVLTRLVDVGATVRRGDTLATLDTQDARNRLRSAEADVSAADAELVEARGTEARKAKLLSDGWTPKATYDTALRNLRSAEARLAAAKANLDLTRDQLHYTTLKAEFDGLITAVGVEAGQNVAAGQMVIKLARPSDKDAVFNIAETAFTDHNPGSEPLDVIVWPLSNPDLKIEGVVREISPIAELHDPHLHRQSNIAGSTVSAAVRHEHLRSLEAQLGTRGDPPTLSPLREERLPRCLGVRSGLRQRRAASSHCLPL